MQTYLEEVHVKLFKLVNLEDAVEIASVALSQADQATYADLVQLQTSLLRALHASANQLLEVLEVPKLRGRLKKIVIGVRLDGGLRFVLVQLVVEETLSILQSTVILLVEQPSADHQACASFAIWKSRREKD